MAKPTVGMEASAITVLKRAVELDEKRRFTEALVCYQEGLNLLLEALKGNDMMTLVATGFSPGTLCVLQWEPAAYLSLLINSLDLLQFSW